MRPYDYRRPEDDGEPAGVDERRDRDDFAPTAVRDDEPERCACEESLWLRRKLLAHADALEAVVAQLADADTQLAYRAEGYSTPAELRRRAMKLAPALHKHLRAHGYEVPADVCDAVAANAVYCLEGSGPVSSPVLSSGPRATPGSTTQGATFSDPRIK